MLTEGCAPAVFGMIALIPDGNDVKFVRIRGGTPFVVIVPVIIRVMKYRYFTSICSRMSK